MSYVLLIIFGVVTIIFAILAISWRNPFYSALSLLGLAISQSAIYFIIGSTFIGAIQLIVYAGAVVVLFVFVITTMRLREGEYTVARITWWKILSIPLLILMAVGFYDLLSGSGVAQKVLSFVASTDRVGRLLLWKYAFSFEIVSIILLIAILGGVFLAMSNDNKEKKG